MERGENEGAMVGEETLAAVEIDRVHELLSSRRCRYALYHLIESGARCTVDELATEIAASQFGVEQSNVRPETRRRVATALYHHHLPRLAEYGVVTFDPDGRVVRATTQNSYLEQQLQVAIAADANFGDR